METSVHLSEETGARPHVTVRAIDPTTRVLSIRERPNEAEVSIFVDDDAIDQLVEALAELRSPQLPQKVYDALLATRPVAGEAPPRYTQWGLTVTTFAAAYGVQEGPLTAALRYDAENPAQHFPTDKEGKPLAWPDPSTPGWWIDAWDGLYPSRAEAIADSREWTAKEEDRVLAHGEYRVNRNAG